MSHPLDRPVLSALCGARQASLAIKTGTAMRFQPGYATFAVCPDLSPQALDDLARLDMPEGLLITVEAQDMAVPRGMVVLKDAVLAQMVLTAPARFSRGGIAVEPLDKADAADMLALATLTEPGPFYDKTHRLGDFVGVRHDGRLVAMAGERMKPDGFTEVSGVCVHPDARGRGYAGAMIKVVTDHILARGEQAFLHSYPDNAGAMALYQSLGFAERARVNMRVLAKA